MLIVIFDSMPSWQTILTSAPPEPPLSDSQIALHQLALRASVDLAAALRNDVSVLTIKIAG
jgi:hypothetical protein